MIKVIIFRLILPKNKGSSVQRVSQPAVIKQFFYTYSTNAARVVRQKRLVVIIEIMQKIHFFWFFNVRRAARWNWILNWKGKVEFDNPEDEMLWQPCHHWNIAVVITEVTVVVVSVALQRHFVLEESVCLCYQGEQRAIATPILNTRKMKTSNLVRNFLLC